AELIIGPVAARGDPERQEYPAPQNPGPHCAREGGSDLARDERADREAEGNREADIADVERRRVEGEAGVLEQGIETLPGGRREGQALEGAGGEEEGGKEAETERRLRSERRDQRLFAKPLFEQRNERSREAEDRQPQEHRAFVVAPCARDLEQHGLQAVAIARNEFDRHVGAHEEGDQKAKR